METGTQQGQSALRSGGGMEECIRNCIECAEFCLRTISHCLQKGGKHATSDHVTLLSNCVEICQTSAKFMISGSKLHVHTCGACAEVCSACAKDCRTMSDDTLMQQCAEVCERCAQSCRKMAAH